MNRNGRQKGRDREIEKERKKERINKQHTGTATATQHNKRESKQPFDDINGEYNIFSGFRVMALFQCIGSPSKVPFFAVIVFITFHVASIIIFSIIGQWLYSVCCILNSNKIFY